MTYPQAIDFLYSQLPIFHRIGPAALKPSLENTIQLASFFNNPHHNQVYIHVAGTNGKGSCAHMLASIFQEAGYKTGLYTSPHLVDFRERIKINGKLVSKSFVTKFVNEAKPIIEKVKPSFFELTVVMALKYFNHKKVDIAIIETGMGGLLDSTNIITPILSLITNISFDHQNILGNTLQEIAAQKAGIIKPNVPFVLGEPNDAITPVFENYASKCNAKRLTQKINFPLSTDLKGEFQNKNLSTIAVALPYLMSKFSRLNQSKVQMGLNKVLSNTNLEGRFQTISENPKFILDVAHNIEGLKTVLSEIKKINYKRLHIIIGMLADKSRNQLLSLFPQDATYYVTQPNVPRKLSAQILFEEFKANKFQSKLFLSVKDAVKSAKQNAKKNDLIVALGSFFIISEILDGSKNIDNQLPRGGR
jgi:dihydrofolate synthase/folylpolyglutamate synthase